MTTNLIPLLSRLAEAAPEVCSLAINNSYDIGPYRFNFLSDGSLQGSTGLAVDTGRPALAWLADALMAAIEARGWGWDVRKDVTRGAFVFTPKSSYEADHAGTTAEALLAALVKAVEAERVR